MSKTRNKFSPEVRERVEVLRKAPEYFAMAGLDRHGKG